MKTTRYSVLFRVLSYSTIGLFLLLAAAGVAAYTIHSSNAAVEANSARNDNIGTGPGPNAPAPGEVRPPATPPVGILATPPRELLAASGSVPPSPVAASRGPALAQNAPPSFPTTTIARAQGSNERTVARPPQPAASAPSEIAGPVEVRRAIPVTHPTDSHGPANVPRAILVSYPANANATRSSVAVAPSPVPPPPSVTEQQIVETLPGGRTRITFIRTVRRQVAARGTAALTD
jgi:hypothetical protein